MLKKTIVKWLIAPVLILSFSNLTFAEVDGSKNRKPKIQKENNKAPATTPHKVGKKIGHDKPIAKQRKLAKAEAKASHKKKTQVKRHHKAKAKVKKQKTQQKAKPAVKDMEDI